VIEALQVCLPPEVVPGERSGPPSLWLLVISEKTVKKLEKQCFSSFCEIAPPIKLILNFVGACAHGVYQALFSAHTIKNWKRAPGDEDYIVRAVEEN
jgi:hypothetical protein